MSISKTSDFKSQEVAMERKIDCCRFTEALRNSMFINIFAANLLSSVDFDIKCPYRAGVYTITNFTIAVPSIVPFPSNTYVCIQLHYYAKFADFKKLVNLYNGVAYFSYKT